jgi:hypothetical protein
LLPVSGDFLHLLPVSGDFLHLLPVSGDFLPVFWFRVRLATV